MNKEDIRLAAENSLEFFTRLIQPQSLLGSIHCELFSWLTREDAKSHQIILLPRGHRKSYAMAMFAVWLITRNPAITILYISSTSNLANKQLGLIKDILTSDIYRYYWPEMIHPDEAKRTKWSESEISVDHPIRKAESIREPTIFTAGLTTNVVGLHCDIAMLDDLVTNENSLTKDGREKVAEKYALLTSIKNPGAREVVAGTRYDPDDLYGDMLSKVLREYDDEGNLVFEGPLYEDFTRVLESVGDGSGEYLWPRQQRKDGQWYGFDRKIYERIKAQYSGNERLLRAQYYNDPAGGSNKGLDKNLFQYYDRTFLSKYNNDWYLKGAKLNILPAIDFAFTTKDSSDYTAIAVVGVDLNNNYYILDIDRFKTNLISEYFEHLFKLYQKWGFSKVRAEATAAQEVIIEDLKHNYIRKLDLALTIDTHKPHSDKTTRTFNILEPKYSNGQVWHYMGGNCQILEEELLIREPPHDDVRDAVASAIEGALAPTALYRKHKPIDYSNYTHSRFGGLR